MSWEDKGLYWAWRGRVFPTGVGMNRLRHFRCFRHSSRARAWCGDVSQQIPTDHR
jgi:hypothetical protein